MQKGILITDGTDVKAKNVYGGDTSDATMNAEVARLQAKFPTFTVTLFASDQDSIFVSTVVNSSLPTLQ